MEKGYEKENHTMLNSHFSGINAIGLCRKDEFYADTHPPSNLC